MDIRKCSMREVDALCARFHSYGGAGSCGVYSFGVYENDQIVAAFAWQPPALGSATSVCPEAPHGVLSLSRMVAVPRDERALRHISKPLRAQMRKLIDRTRWPVLVTYSDEGEGHTGHVYKCSGWEKTKRRKSPTYRKEDGSRGAPKPSMSVADAGLVRIGYRFIQRWEHRVCNRGDTLKFMERNGWVRVPVEGKAWRSGNQAYRIERSIL